VIVLDASAAVALITDRPLDSANAVRARLLAPGTRPCAPHLIDLEVAQTLRGFVRRGELSIEHAARALQDFAELSLNRYVHHPLIPRIWQLRENLTAYDAAYVALAEALDAPLLTRDVRLSRAPHRARVEIV
jgi:predicted nucleic acid-binding protein